MRLEKPIRLATPQEKEPLVIIDYSVLCYKITGRLQNLGVGIKDPTLYERPYTGDKESNLWVSGFDPLMVKVIKYAWLKELFTPDRVTSLLGFPKIYVCLDKKIEGKYWRSRHYSPYKERRRSLPCLAHRIVEVTGFSLLNQFEGWFKRLEEAGFEADDHAGAIARMAKVAKVPCNYVTIDSDWLQLLKPGDLYVNPSYKPSPLRDKEALERYNKKNESNLRSIKTIAQHKQIYGDTSDNICANTAPLGIIDLWQPLEVPNLNPLTLQFDREVYERESPRVRNTLTNYNISGIYP